MTDWKGIHLDFTFELQKEWESKGFSYKECKEWIDVGMKTTEADFCAWLRNSKKLTIKQILNYESSEQLRKDYANYKNNPYPDNSQIIQDVKNNPQNWRIDEVIAEYDNLGKAVKKELTLIHNSAQIGHEGEIFGSIGRPEDIFSWHPVHLLTQKFNQDEISEIRQVLNKFKMEMKLDAKIVYKNK
jgi:hypothetical protein